VRSWWRRGAKALPTTARSSPSAARCDGTGAFNRFMEGNDDSRASDGRQGVDGWGSCDEEVDVDALQDSHVEPDGGR
jgi:hypothetical protein